MMEIMFQEQQMACFVFLVIELSVLGENHVPSIGQIQMHGQFVANMDCQEPLYAIPQFFFRRELKF